MTNANTVNGGEAYESIYGGDGTYTDYDQAGASHVFDWHTNLCLNKWQREGRWGEAQLLDWATTFWVKEGYWEQ